MYEFLEYYVPVIMIVTGLIVIFFEAGLGIKAKYGRYSSINSIGLKAPIAWLIQESPAFLVPLALIIFRGLNLFDGLQQLNSNLVILGYFMIHYFHRYVYYGPYIQILIHTT